MVGSADGVSGERALWWMVGLGRRWVFVRCVAMVRRCECGRCAVDDGRVEGRVDQAAGKVKEGVGKATGDESLEQQGKTDQAKGDVKEGVGKLKDAVRDAGR
jgi:uncharacterized protein YjbJ (UPF0337 family)